MSERASTPNCSASAARSGVCGYRSDRKWRRASLPVQLWSRFRTVALSCLGALLFALTAHAGPAEAAIVALMRLSEQRNYGWTATVTDDARTYDIIGRTVVGGYTHVQMPVINSVRRQLGRSVTDTHIDLIYRGNVECVVETDDGWKRLSDLPLLPSDASGNRSGASVTVPGLPGIPVSTATVNSRRGANGRASGPQAYSNLQLGISHPHEELGVIVSSHVGLNVEGDLVTGTLSDLGAQLLLVRDGQENLTPLRATGTFKVWLRAGSVAKYQVNLRGTVEVRLPSGRKEITVQQTTDTVLRNVGSTTVEVPDEARAKLGA